MILEYIGGIIFFIVLAWFAYMSAHIVSEQKKGKQIDLPWESEETKESIRNLCKMLENLSDDIKKLFKK